MVPRCVLDQMELPNTTCKLLCDLALTFLPSLLIHCFLLAIIHPTISNHLPLSKHAMLFLCLPVIVHTASPARNALSRFLVFPYFSSHLTNIPTSSSPSLTRTLLTQGLSHIHFGIPKHLSHNRYEIGGSVRQTWDPGPMLPVLE